MKHKKLTTSCFISKQQQGFTLIEFMVASVLGLVVIAGAGALYSYTKRLNDIGQARVATLQDLRNASTMIGQDARTAGVFGCANLGRYHDPDANTTKKRGIEIQYDDTALPAANQLIQPLTLSGTAPNAAAGVRWIKASDVASKAANIWTSSGVTLTPAANSGVLLFYYGEGSLAYKGFSGTAVTFGTDEQHPNKTVENLLTDRGQGGYVVAAGCNDLVFKKVDGKHTNADFSVTIPDPTIAIANSTVTGSTTSISDHADMILQRYKVVAYVVGDIAGEPTSLYRFEFGNNGDDWSAPQQLAKNVTKMEADFLFVTDCKSGMLNTSGASGGVASGDLNSQQFDVKSADDGDTFAVGTDNHGPSSIQLRLTYDFPKIRGGSVDTGKTDEKFDISAVVRGGNVCASRKIVPL